MLLSVRFLLRYVCSPHPASYAESLLLDLEHLMATLDQMTSGQSAHFKISDLFTNGKCNDENRLYLLHIIIMHLFAVIKYSLDT